MKKLKTIKPNFWKFDNWKLATEGTGLFDIFGHSILYLYCMNYIYLFYNKRIYRLMYENYSKEPKILQETVGYIDYCPVSKFSFFLHKNDFAIINVTEEKFNENKFLKSCFHRCLNKCGYSQDVKRLYAIYTTPIKECKYKINPIKERVLYWYIKFKYNKLLKSINYDKN